MLIGMAASASWTRLAFLAHGQNRAEADNRATLAGTRRREVPDHVAVARVRARPMLEQLLGGMPRAGVALVAVDRGGEVAGTLSLVGKQGAINAAVVGRHGRCDLYLAGDESLSLRHALVVVDERGGFRAIDLRTGGGLRAAGGRRQEGIASTDEAVIGMGEHVVIARARRGEDPAGPMRSPWLPPLALGTGVADTCPPDRLAITITGGVTRTGGALLGKGESRRALLELADASAREIWPVGDRAMSNGILLGRYERCDGHGSRILARRGISRVHAVILAVDGAPHVIDLGSTNGTWIDGREVRLSPLVPGMMFRLGEHGPTITWKSAGS